MWKARGPWIPETISQPWSKGLRGVTFSAQCSEYQLLIPSSSGGFLQGSWATGGIEFIC